jgi:bifunctional non-homologous end joining protein LigD
MTLQKYHEKRNFDKTAEPYGATKSTGKNKIYIIQKHAASHLHYDFRLEIDGVLKSWAIPKGPSLDPLVKRLAVHVEDHPVDYADFEGTIPSGEYGGGTVMLWDKGTWSFDNARDILKDYKKGILTFTLNGERLKGDWKLIQIKKDPKNWLLVKLDDTYARSEKKFDITERETVSIKTQRSMDEIASGVKKKQQKQRKAAKKQATVLNNSSNMVAATQAELPDFVSPELATLVDRPPVGADWLHEIKYDGYRLICVVKNKKAHLYTRSKNDWTHKFKALVFSIESEELPNLILDGEVVVLDKEGKSDFQLLQNALRLTDHSNLVYYVFDILYFDKYDLTKTKLIERKKILQHLIAHLEHKDIIRYSDHVIGNGEKLFAKAQKLKYEGIVSKLADSFYIQARTKQWLKIKCMQRQEFIVCGYTKPAGLRTHFGSLLLGFYNENQELIYCGHVGTGFTQESLQEIAKKLKQYTSSHMPFKKKPTGVSGVTWVEPKVVAEVEFSEWTQDKILRHPSFKGLRYDKKPESVIFEKVKSINEIKPTSEAKEMPEKSSKRLKSTVVLSHPEKILYPADKITKQDIANYYTMIKDWILPYIINRPLTLLRCPQGIDKKFFYQKHLNNESEQFIFPIRIEGKQETDNYIYIKDFNGLINTVQMDVLEIHPWPCKIDNIEKPDYIVFDLDPGPEVEWSKVVSAAHDLREHLEKISLTSFIKTTGGKGFHIVVPIQRKYTWDDVKNFAKTFVQVLVQQNPKNYVGTMTKTQRTGKIFIDYLRNERGATAVAPYSTRARLGGTVATPLHWDEVNKKILSSTFTIHNLSKRLDKLQEDPWQGFYKLKQKLPL